MSTTNTSKIIELRKNAIDFHCHGVGQYDFTDIESFNLDDIEAILAQRDHHSILTVYLPKKNAEHFFDFMQIYAEAQKQHKYPHISGIAIEGPLLSSRGGTPKSTLWAPTKEEWQRFADCGKQGLIYIVFSPDAPIFDSKTHNTAMDQPATDLTWVVNTLMSGGVLPSPGHFSKNAPEESVKALEVIFNAAQAHGLTAVTDHFLNDMPHNFNHAWRNADERSHRQQDLAQIKPEQWSLDNLEEKLGPVPACLIRHARKGTVKLCQNFDGEHVDLELIRYLLPLIGPENLIMMTDSIESRVLAGRELSTREDSTLLYEEEGIVAAGTQGVAHQIRNMLSLGLSDQEIKTIIHSNASFIINQHNHVVYDQAVGL